MWLAIALAALVVLAAALVVVEPLVMFGPAAAATGPAGQHAAAGIANTNPFYEGRHCAPDPEATTVLIARADLTRPYVTAGGTR